MERSVFGGEMNIFRRADGPMRFPDGEVHAATHAEEVHQERRVFRA